jgi:hypothetical protein
MAFQGGAILASLLTTPAWAQQAPLMPPPAITVDGQASVEVAPDTALVSLGVESNRPTASAATADVAKAAQAIVDQIATEGIDSKDVTTTSIALEPIYPDEISGKQPHIPRSFRASTDLVVTIKPAERAGLVVAHLVDKGANTIDGIAYSSSEEAKKLDDLRVEATRDALRKAQIYAGALGLKLGRVLDIAPGGDGGGPQPYFAKSMVAAPAPVPRIPVKPGSLTLRSNVSIRWEIVPQ